MPHRNEEEKEKGKQRHHSIASRFAGVVTRSTGTTHVNFARSHREQHATDKDKASSTTAETSKDDSTHEPHPHVRSERPHLIGSRRLAAISHQLAGATSSAGQAISLLPSVRSHKAGSRDWRHLPKYHDLEAETSGVRSLKTFPWAGPADQLGTLNLLNDALRLQAAREEIKTGHTISLNSRVHMAPMFGKMTATWDFGTGRSSEQAAEHGIIARGVLLDIAGYLADKSGGRTAYDPASAYPISLHVLKDCARAEGVRLHAGDVVLVRTGFTARYERSTASERQGWTKVAGIEQGEHLAEWSWNTHIAALATDSPSIEVVPFKPGQVSLREALGKVKMPVAELVDLEALTAHCRKTGRWTFYFTSAPSFPKNDASSSFTATF